MSHTVKLTVDDKDIQQIKALVKTSPDFLEDNKMSPSRLNNGSKVLVEYTPMTWSGKKAKNDEASFGNGCTLKLQSILILEDKYNFQYLRKRHRMK